MAFNLGLEKIGDSQCELCWVFHWKRRSKRLFWQKLGREGYRWGGQILEKWPIRRANDWGGLGLGGRVEGWLVFIRAVVEDYLDSFTMFSGALKGHTGAYAFGFACSSTCATRLSYSTPPSVTILVSIWSDWSCWTSVATLA